MVKVKSCMNSSFTDLTYGSIFEGIGSLNLFTRNQSMLHNSRAQHEKSGAVI